MIDSIDKNFYDKSYPSYPRCVNSRIMSRLIGVGLGVGRIFGAPLHFSTVDTTSSQLRNCPFRRIRRARNGLRIMDGAQGLLWPLLSVYRLG